MKIKWLRLTLGIVVCVVLLWSLIDSTAILDPEDTTAERIEWEELKKVTVEGSFTDANGNVIFAPEKSYKEDTAVMPVAYSYVLGYNSPTYGTSGLRDIYRKHLYNDLDTGVGGTIQLTIDDILQNKAYSALKQHQLTGSIVVLNAKNAEILAMAGYRGIDYDLNNLDAEKWNRYTNSGIDGMLLPPATGDYKAPGSVFKILTAAAAIKNGMGDFVFDDVGSKIEIDGTVINNAYSVDYGPENLQSALIHSSNTYFGTLSMELGERAMRGVFNDFLVGHEIDLGFTTLRSAAKLDGSDKNLAMVGFGQGGVAISPLHLAMIGQSFVNNGRMIKPSLIKTMYDANGKIIYKNTEHELLTQTVKPEVADAVKNLMQGVTLTNYPDWDYTDRIYSKTGTAQTTDGSKIYNSYFLCMTEEYVILVSINNTPGYGANYSYIAESFLNELY